MVLEITYEKYKSFCSLLPCKDAFYFLKNLFVKFPDDDNIYCIKYDLKKTPEKCYQAVVSKNTLKTVSLDEFLLGLPTTDAGTYIKDELYRNNSFLVIL